MYFTHDVNVGMLTAKIRAVCVSSMLSVENLIRTGLLSSTGYDDDVDRSRGLD